MKDKWIYATAGVTDGLLFLIFRTIHLGHPFRTRQEDDTLC